MEAPEINQIIDKVSEKLSIGAERLGNIALEAAKQVSNLGLAYTLLGVAFFSIVVMINIRIWKIIKLLSTTPVDEYSEITGLEAIITISIDVMFFVFGIIYLHDGLYMWLAPYLYLLKG